FLCPCDLHCALIGGTRRVGIKLGPKTAQDAMEISCAGEVAGLAHVLGCSSNCGIGLITLTRERMTLGLQASRQGEASARADSLQRCNARIHFGKRALEIALVRRSPPVEYTGETVPHRLRELGQNGECQPGRLHDLRRTSHHGVGNHYAPDQSKAGSVAMIAL